MYRVCPGCKEPLPPGQYACREDWFRMPYELRTAISRTYSALSVRDRQTLRDYRAAKAAGDQWFSQNTKGAT